MYGIRVAGGASQDTFCNVYADVPNRFYQTISPTKKKRAKKGTKRFLQNIKNFCVKGTGRQKALDKEKRFQEKLIKYFQIGNGRVAGRRVWGRGELQGAAL
jgi:hypothetical protein